MALDPKDDVWGPALEFMGGEAFPGIGIGLFSSCYPVLQQSGSCCGLWKTLVKWGVGPQGTYFSLRGLISHFGFYLLLPADLSIGPPKTLTFIFQFFYSKQVIEADVNKKVLVVHVLSHALTGKMFLRCFRAFRLGKSIRGSKALKRTLWLLWKV